jgi:hypothetical protein
MADIIWRADAIIERADYGLAVITRYVLKRTVNRRTVSLSVRAFTHTPSANAAKGAKRGTERGFCRFWHLLSSLSV